MDGAGMSKAMDLLMWELHISGRDKVSPVIWKLADQVQERYGVVVRPYRKKDIQDEISRFMEVYNSAWEKNWGFVPLTEGEVRHYAKQIKPFLDENWAYIAEKDGETVGAALTLPDYNQALIHMHGRILPFGWAKFLWYRRKIDRVRVFALGVKPDWQHTGVAAKFYERHFEAATRTPQTSGEMGWILETNKNMNKAMEAMGGEVVRRFRLYERELGG
jgi:GNAT superfamily N-acetyltransferase